MFCTTMAAQNVTANQNQQIINVNVPVIEKKVYVDRYRTVYVNKPINRKARKMPAPVQLLGYLWVYPEDLGDFKQVPVGVIQTINEQAPYGRNNWRIPTPDELSVMEANAEKIGLGSEIYLATDHRNGILRMVSTGLSVKEKKAKLDAIISSGQGHRIGNTIWHSQVLKKGTQVVFKPEEIFNPAKGVNLLPQEWRIPTIDEVVALCEHFGNDAIKVWNFLENITSNIIKKNDDIRHYAPGWVGHSNDNSGYLLYWDSYDKENSIKVVRFYLGSTDNAPRIEYDEDVYKNSIRAYLIGVYDGPYK